MYPTKLLEHVLNTPFLFLRNEAWAWGHTCNPRVLEAGPGNHRRLELARFVYIVSPGQLGLFSKSLSQTYPLSRCKRTDCCWLVAVWFHEWTFQFTPFPGYLLQGSDIARVPIFFHFKVKSRDIEMHIFYFLKTLFNSSFLLFMLLIKLFWWSIKLSFLICL